MKIVLFGCQQIAVDFIRFLLNQKSVSICLVITYELPLDKTYGYESVLETFSDYKFDVLNPSRITTEIVEKISDINPDVIFSIYYRKILPKSILNLPKLGCINIHPGLLPKYRGPIPTAWSIENGEKNFGITIHLMDEGIDTGPIYVQELYPIKKNETGFELYTRAMKIGAKLLADNFNDIVKDKIPAKPQKGIGSYYGKKDGKYMIDWRESAERINNKIRVHSKPFNSAETLLFNRYLLINKAKVIYDEKYVAQGSGKIVDIVGDYIVISCAEGCLMLLDYEIVPKLNNEEKKIYYRIGNKLD